MSKRESKKGERSPALSDDWKTFVERGPLTGDNCFRALIYLCEVWDIKAGPDWTFVGCILSYDHKGNFVAEVPGMMSHLLLNGLEPARPNIGADELRTKERRLAEIEAELHGLRTSARENGAAIRKLKAEQRKLKA